MSLRINSNFHLSGDNVLHETKKNCKGKGICAFVHESLCYKLRKDLSLNWDEIQSLSIEISKITAKTFILNVVHRPRNSDMKQCESHKNTFFKKWQKFEKR